MVTDTATVDEADEFYKEMKSLFHSLSMNLQEWALNLKDFYQGIPESDRDEVKALHRKSWNKTEHEQRHSYYY